MKVQSAARGTEVHAMMTLGGNGRAEHISYLRRQAEFCLRTSQLCSNSAAADDLKLLAAEFHARAQRVEFEAI